MKNVAIALALLATTGCAWLSTHYEEPSYSVIRQSSEDNRIEFRHYDEAIVAEVTVDGSRDEASSKGFRLLADYIFGNNSTKNAMDMTAPVSQQALSQNITMTTPSSQQESSTNWWKVRFHMPKAHTLPKPNNSAIKLLSIPPHDAAVIRFSGRWSDASFLKHRNTLIAALSREALRTDEVPIYAYYDHPLTPWFLQRNEILIKINGTSE